MSIQQIGTDLKLLGTLCVPPRGRNSRVQSVDQLNSRSIAAWRYIDPRMGKSSLELARLSRYEVGFISPGAHRVVHDARLDTVWRDAVHYTLQIRGKSFLSMEGRNLRLDSGQWVAVAGDESYTITTSAGTERLLIAVSQNQGSSPPVPEAIVGYFSIRGADRVVFSLAKELLGELATLTAADTHQVAHLVAEALTSTLTR